MKQYDVFLSSTVAGADRDAIRASLSERGVTYYDPTRSAMGAFAKSELESLAACRVYLLILSNDLRAQGDLTRFTEIRRECEAAMQLEAKGALCVEVLALSEDFRFADGFDKHDDAIGWFFYTQTRGFYIATTVEEAVARIASRVAKD